MEEDGAVNDGERPEYDLDSYTRDLFSGGSTGSSTDPASGGGGYYKYTRSDLYSHPKIHNSGKLGIALLSIFFFTLFISLFVPWFISHGYEYNYSTGEKTYEWKVYDYDGEGYWGDESDVCITKDAWDELDSLDSGRLLGFIGPILGMVMSIPLIVLASIWPRNLKRQRILSLVRGILAVSLLIPSLFLLSCGARFAGLTVSSMTSGDINIFMIALGPILLILIGVITTILTVMSFWYEFGVMEMLNLRMKSAIPARSAGFSSRIKRLATWFVILSMVSLVSLHLLPILSYTEGEENEYVTAPELFVEEAFDEVDSLFYLDLFEWFMLVTFIIGLVALGFSVFYESNIHRRTGHILILCGNLFLLPLFLSVLFKMLFIITTFTESEMKRPWYGYNYVPLLALIGMVIVSVFYVITSIKGMIVYNRSKYKDETFLPPDPKWGGPVPHPGSKTVTPQDPRWGGPVPHPSSKTILPMDPKWEGPIPHPSTLGGPAESTRIPPPQSAQPQSLDDLFRD